jgi:hypothetical protein
MYHIEFYTKILEQYTDAKYFLSGIFGDVWAGNIKKQMINGVEDIHKLGYTHGLSASSKYSLLPHDTMLLQNFYNENKEKLQYDFYQIVTTIRLKIILISYLISLPESFGCRVFSPYLDMETALSMLCLPADRRKNRRWQRDYFKRKKIDVENMRLEYSSENNLDYFAAHKIKLSPLNYNYYANCIQKDYFDEINGLYENEVFQAKHEEICEGFINIPYFKKVFHFFHVGFILRKLFGFKNHTYYENIFLKKYNAYLVLKPFEYIFGRRI